jgi:hypothetical protein
MAQMMMQISLRQCHKTPLLHLRLQLHKFLAFDAKGGEGEYVRLMGSQ